MSSPRATSVAVLIAVGLFAGCTSTAAVCIRPSAVEMAIFAEAHKTVPEALENGEPIDVTLAANAASLSRVVKQICDYVEWTVDTSAIATSAETNIDVKHVPAVVAIDLACLENDYLPSYVGGRWVIEPLPEPLTRESATRAAERLSEFGPRTQRAASLIAALDATARLFDVDVAPEKR